MDINKLNEAQEVFKQLTEIENQIKEINKFASTIAEVKLKSGRVFSVTIETDMPEGQKEDTKEIDIVIDRNSEHPLKQFFDQMNKHFDGLGNAEESKQTKQVSYTSEISESSILKLLAIMLVEKQNLKTSLIKKLEDTGVKI